ncbi:MAG: type IX secretion system sortase PorU [Tannerella sp.]|nr:type IX secretion system sortase PorU [Tannerella sp.]
MKNVLRTQCIILLCVAISASILADASRYAAKSVLSEGKWVKISIEKTGIYKLTYSDLKEMGFSDPAKVSIHGYGGWPIEEDFKKAEYMDDVPPVAIWRGSDYLLFYGRGTVKWTYDSVNKSFRHVNNVYATLGYYFVTDATETGEAVAVPSEGDAPVVIDTYDDYMLYEQDMVSVTTPGRPYSGRDLFGESFDTYTSRDFKFAIPGITNDDGKISYRFVAKVKSGTGVVTMSADGVKLASATISQNTYIYTAALSASQEALWEGEKNENTTVNISFSVTQQTSHLDYIRLQMKRRLQPYGSCTFFRSIESENKAARFLIKNVPSDMVVFDVTEGNRMRKIETERNGTELSFSIPAGQLREFAMVDIANKDLPSPVVVGEVAPQNLHGMPQTDMIILAPNVFVSEAERLARIHRSHDNLTVAVVTPEQVYNEFSGGGQEATAIRRFMKMFYDRKTSDDDAPKYLLLFGDGRFDNRKLTKTWENSSDNYIVTYQSVESIGESSYVSDDYFGLLYDNEGAEPINATMCIGVGRFPVATVTQAKDAVNKVISYIENSNYGFWKNKLCFVADDGNSSDNHSINHMEESNLLAQYIEDNHPQYIPRKLFFDAYKKSNSGGKPTYPDIRANIQKELKEGVLIINYTGHSDAESWAEEKVMTQADISSATYPNLPLWITASCDFAPFDAMGTSAGEEVFFNKKSGGIALYTTARVAYSDENLQINKLFLTNLFEKQDNGRHQRLGDVLKNSKNAFKSSNGTFQNQKIMSFTLIGDPALTLAFPDDYNMEVTEINGQPVTSKPMNFKAFENVTVSGRINAPDGIPANDFNGQISVSVFDSQDQITTLDNNGTDIKFTYSDYPSVMYIGNDSVRNGGFSFTFTVPKDIFYSYQNGKISLYASDRNSGKEANGSYKNFTLGGTADIAGEDTAGPDIRMMYLNTSDFKDGGKVNETPVFAAVVWDESGINVSGGGIGHDITLTIDNNPVMSYVLNNYYSTYIEGEKGESIIKFPIPKLEAGRHTGEFKIWDSYNNSSSGVFNFVVADNYKPSIISLTAGPSPASDYVNFIISHDLPESLINVQIQVFDMAGRLQWQHEEWGSSEMFDSYKINWTLTDGAGARLRPGVYVYRAVISSDKSNEVSEAKKLIILAQ